MAVYVDWLLNHGWRPRGQLIKSCHLLADTEEELHALALSIGLRREWFQSGSRVAHYDLTESLRALAVAAGAVELTRATFRPVYRRLRRPGGE